MSVEITTSGKILKMKVNNNQSSYVANGGVYLINPLALKNMDKPQHKIISLEDELLPEFISSGGVLYGLECFGSFIDIGIPRDYYRATEILF